jgi:hypothetical protein
MEDSFNLYYAANTVQLEQADWTVCDQNCRQDKGQLSLILTVFHAYHTPFFNIIRGYGDFVFSSNSPR